MLLGADSESLSQAFNPASKTLLWHEQEFRDNSWHKTNKGMLLISKMRPQNHLSLLYGLCELALNHINNTPQLKLLNRCEFGEVVQVPVID